MQFLFQSPVGSKGAVARRWRWRVRRRSPSRRRRTASHRGRGSAPDAASASPRGFCSRLWISSGTKTASSADAATAGSGKLGLRYTPRPTWYCAKGITSGESWIFCDIRELLKVGKQPCIKFSRWSNHAISLVIAHFNNENFGTNLNSI